MSTNPFTETLARQGWVRLPGVLSADLVARINQDMATAYEICRAVQVKNGLAANTDGTVHHILGLGPSFLELLERITQAPLAPVIHSYFGGKSILNSYGGVINIKSKPSYVCKIHRDVRFFTGELPFMLNLLAMLDDFTLANGATHLLSGSHQADVRPTNEAFYAQADRATGQAGDVILFNSNLWHCAGLNTTDQLRRAVTITLTKPFLKQQLDYPRSFGWEKAAQLSDELRQLIGFNARVPATLEEWYQPPEKRFYQAGQD